MSPTRDHPENCPFSLSIADLTSNLRELTASVQALRETVARLETRLEEKEKASTTAKWLIGIVASLLTWTASQIIPHLKK